MIRLAFVGQSTYFLGVSLTQTINGINPKFFDYRPGDSDDHVRQELQKFKPDIVIAFKPESFPPDFFKSISGEKIGWFTEPIPRSTGLLTGLSLSSQTRDLRRRKGALADKDFSQFNKFISYDPYISDSLADLVDVWRSFPLPVDDHYYVDEVSVTGPAMFGFLGRTTKHRDKFLLPALHSTDLLYVSHGAFGSTLDYLLKQINVGVNLHNEDYPNFENRVPLHLACGHLVVSEPLSPRHGLEPDTDFLEIGTPREFLLTLSAIIDDFSSFHPARVRGRMKAEYFRSSRIYTEIVNAL